VIVADNHFAGQGLSLLMIVFSINNFFHINYCL